MFCWSDSHWRIYWSTNHSKKLHVVCYHSKNIGTVNVFKVRTIGRAYANALMYCKASAQSSEVYYNIIDLLFEFEKMNLNAVCLYKRRILINHLSQAFTRGFFSVTVLFNTSWPGYSAIAYIIYCNVNWTKFMISLF